MGHHFRAGGAFPYLPIFLLTEIIEAILRKMIVVVLRHLEERTPTMIKLSNKTTLRNVPHQLAKFGLDFTIAGIASINSLSAKR